MRHFERRLPLHDQINLDNVARPVVIDDARVDLLDLFGEGHGFVGDQVLSPHEHERQRVRVRRGDCYALSLSRSEGGCAQEKGEKEV